MLLRARTVLPVCAPPIDDGAVLVSGERIQRVGRWADLRSFGGNDAVDLGESILLPGLINAHCHLDYTDMAGQLAPGKNFSDWIKGIVGLKAEWSYADFALSWLRGAKMLLRSGTTTVVDMEAVPELLPDVIQSTPLRVICCLELLSVRSKQSARQMVEAAVQHLRPLGADCGLSPHAPYSTTPALLRAAASAAQDEGWLLTTHVAESADEFEMYLNASGAMFDWLKSQRDMSDCGECSPIVDLARHDVLSPKFLAVHANYLAREDAALLARSGSNLVHCPRSHAFFRHNSFPFEELEKAGVNICLGTDSLATVRKSKSEPLALNMLSEMRAFLKSFPSVEPTEVLRMTTLHAAKAIHRENELGLISTDALADLIAVPFAGGKRDAAEAVIEHRDDVVASMIHGEWAINPLMNE